MQSKLTSIWKGSKHTAQTVAEQITQKYGTKEAKKYHPELNCFTYQGWKQRGYFVKKGEKSIKSITFINTEKKSKETGKIKNYSYPKIVNLFYIKQVEKK